MLRKSHSLERLPLEGRRWSGADVLVVGGIAGLVVLAFWDVVAGGRVFFFRDFAYYFYPKRFLVAEAIRQFDIPFWNHYSGCGEPLLGTYQVAVFYPLALIYYVLRMPESFMWFVVAHFFVSGAGMYFLMRAFGARRAAAGVAAVAWGFSPAFVSTVDNVSFMTSLAWLPWCVGFTRRLCLGMRFGAFFGLTASFAMAVLAGGPEPVIFTGAIVAAYAAAFSLGRWRRGSRRAAWQAPLLTAAALVVAVMLSGVELGPFANALRYSGRPELELQTADRWSAAPSDAVLWFLPRFGLFPDRGGIHWRTQYWLKSIYMGVMVPFLALWTVALVRRRRNLFFAIVAAVAMLLAVGRISPLWQVCYRFLPGFSMIRYPVKFFLPAAFAMAVLAGFGVDDALVCARRGARRRVIVLFAALGLAAALFGGGWAVSKLQDNALLRAFAPGEAVRSAESPQAAAAALERGLEKFEGAQWSLGRSAVHIVGGLAALGLAVFLVRRRIARPYGGLALGLALFLDVGVFGAHLNPVAGREIYTEPPSRTVIAPVGETAGRLYMTPELREYFRRVRLDRFRNVKQLNLWLSLVKGVGFRGGDDLLRWLERTSAPRFANAYELDEWLKNTYSPQFVAGTEFERSKETFYPNLNGLWGVRTADSFEPLTVKWHYQLLGLLRHREEYKPGREKFVPRMWGASVIIDQRVSDGRVVPPGFQYLPLRQPGQRALLAEHFLVAESDEEARDILLKSDIDVMKRVVLLGEDAEAAEEHLGAAALLEPAEGLAGAGTARVVSEEGDRMVVEVEAERAALLFVPDNWYPAIRATVDGKPAPIWRANFSYRGVPVAAGRHTVEFRYRPADFYAGLLVTIAGVLALAAFGKFWPEADAR